jgi:hypothetical protein
MPTLSLDAIQQRIAQRDSELQTLRRELDARHSRLQSLKQRKQELQDKLQKIEAEMAAIAAGSQRHATATLKPAKMRPASKPASASRNSQLTLAELILTILRDIGRPLTVLQLTEKVKQRHFRSKSKALHKLVGKNVYALAAKGGLLRAADQSGFLVSPTGHGRAATKSSPKPSIKGAVPQTKTRPAKAAVPALATVKPKPAVKEAAKRASGAKPPQKPLRQVLTEILKKMGTPMTGSDLAQEALEAGYQTSSKNFAQAVWTALGIMDNVENVKGQGYRLKRGKA